MSYRAINPNMYGTRWRFPMDSHLVLISRKTGPKLHSHTRPQGRCEPAQRSLGSASAYCVGSKKRQANPKTGTPGTTCFNGMIGFDDALAVSVSQYPAGGDSLVLKAVSTGVGQTAPRFLVQVASIQQYESFARAEVGNVLICKVITRMVDPKQTGVRGGLVRLSRRSGVALPPVPGWTYHKRRIIRSQTRPQYEVTYSLSVC
jgi:hypothetical protein